MMNKEIQAKINQLSLMEQNLQNFALQKQQFQAQLLEFESAEKELKTSKEAFKIIGNIMVSKSKEDILKDVAERKELLQTRVESFEKQEAKLKERADALQKEVLEEMNKGERA
jgi:prefoldin beta subunit